MFIWNIPILYQTALLYLSHGNMGAEPADIAFSSLFMCSLCVCPSGRGASPPKLLNGFGWHLAQGLRQWRIHKGTVEAIDPPRVVSEDFLVTGFPNFSRPNFPIPGSQKFFPNYKFITPRLLMCLRNSRSPTNRQWHSYLYLYTMWGGYKHYVIWRYVMSERRRYTLLHW